MSAVSIDDTSQMEPPIGTSDRTVASSKVRLSGPTSVSTSVVYTVAPGTATTADYENVAGTRTLTIAAGATVGVIHTRIKGDTLDETAAVTGPVLRTSSRTLSLVFVIIMVVGRSVPRLAPLDHLMSSHLER